MFGIIPVQFDLGWFLSPRVYLGTSFLKPGIRSFWLGPFVTFTLGKYVNVDEARFHGWLMGGLRLSS
ncbi:hypothetical protein D7X12_14670 [Corallococcus sicarius]|uniref:Uncharacterized protein n=1 Tax=Corallococcus sicarius TaxID=2316726 RepID=A0A3A8NP07_9BACT|nr:hypothetical protein D7X12_14670 [Corallococcus sicarius]